MRSRSTRGSAAITTSTNLTYGFGIQHYFTRNLGARAEWQRYSGLSARNDRTGLRAETDVGTGTLGVLWRFE